jgi:RNA polymerase sigma-70 factor, ECF subfamily
MIQNPDYHVMYKKLFDDHFADLCYYVLRRFPSVAPSEADAENIVQEVFIRVFERKNDISDPKSAANLLYLMVRNACISKIRGRKSTLEPFDDHSDPADDEKTSDVDRERTDAEMMGNIEKLRQYVDRLPKKSRKIIKSLYFDQMSHKEYALLDNITEGSARSLEKFALKRLRKMMRNKRLCNWLLIWMLVVGPWKN